MGFYVYVWNLRENLGFFRFVFRGVCIFFWLEVIIDVSFYNWGFFEVIEYFRKK